MSEWTSDELERIAAAEELHLARVRRDGTLGKPVTIWVVRHGHDLVRSILARAHLHLVPRRPGSPRGPGPDLPYNRGHRIRRSTLQLDRTPLAMNQSDAELRCAAGRSAYKEVFSQVRLHSMGP